MYDTIAQNFVKKLIENEFELSSAMDIETLKNNAVILLKEESPILYVVSLINGEILDLQSYEIFMNKYLKYLQNTISQNYAIIALSIVAAEFQNDTDMTQVIDFVKTKELIPYNECYHNWWYVSEKRKTVEMSKSQAKDILHIKQIILDCLQDTQTEQYSFYEIAAQAKQNSDFCFKSNNTLLTFILLCINFLLFFVMILCNAKQYCIMSFGSEYQAIFNMHEYYRIITSCFIHTNIIHLIQNSVYLYYFGTRTEILYGKMNMAMIYFFSGIGSSLLSALCNDAVISVGASGAIFGLIASVWIYSYQHGKKSIGMNYTTLVLFIVIALVMGLVQKNVDYFGHFGGFLLGAFLSFFMLKYKKI